ncbi:MULTISPECIES: hypothetical protein [unclassified Acinetobacter]|uniref:hypothetical protein n=1 Tax=unclassified Acinetobacter TaxID=196816 RepID=UPI0015D121A9|nr:MULTISPECIES: hypothetical protein [unclassified Acinetobacter]
MPKQYPYTGKLQHGGNQDQSNPSRSLSSSIVEVNQPQQTSTRISELLNRLSRNMGAKELQSSTPDNPKFVSLVPAEVTYIDVLETVDQTVRIANVVSSNKQTQIYSGLIGNSAYLRNGALLHIVRGNPEDTIYRRDQFYTVEGAAFQFIDDGTEVTSSPVPWAKREFKIAETAHVATSFSLSRRDFKDLEPGMRDAMIINAVLLGLGAAIDKKMHNYFASKTPAAFSFAAAATRGIAFNELVAVTDGVSTNAAAVQGEFYVSGINAELSKAGGTYITAANRFGVAIPENITLTAVREKNGAVRFDVFCNVEILATEHSDSLIWSA